MSNTLTDKIIACLYGGAIGDAMGAPAEWHYPPEIRERYGYITDFVENWDGPSNIGKGDGRYTDDSHMIQLLCRAYLEHGNHLDAYEFFQRIVPMIALENRWIPEKGVEMPLVERLFYPEKWLYMRWLGNTEPRVAGIGNMVNCGAAMYAAPVGIANAADPEAAYAAAVDIFSAHQHSFGLEAAAVMAACVAEAFKPGASVDSIIEVALDLAKDGTKKAIEAVIAESRKLSDWKQAIAPLRTAIAPYDTSAEDGKNRGNRTDNWQPSREHSIEEVPIALGFLVVTNGDFEESIFGATNYGRDNDSIAGMAGSIAGALHGTSVIRQNWMEQINQANRIDLAPIGQDMGRFVVALQQKQLAKAQKRGEMFKAMTG